MLSLASDNQKIENIFTAALDGLTQDIMKPARHNAPHTGIETYQLLCTRELVRGMVAARLLAEQLSSPMQKDEVHKLSSHMLDTLTHLYPTMGLAPSNDKALEKLSKMSSVSAWKIHTRFLNLFAPQKKERPFPIPFWPASQYKAA